MPGQARHATLRSVSRFAADARWLFISSFDLWRTQDFFWKIFVLGTRRWICLNILLNFCTKWNEKFHIFWISSVWRWLNGVLNHQTDPIFEFRVPKNVEIDMYERFLSFFWLLPLITPSLFEKCYNLAYKLSTEVLKAILFEYFVKFLFETESNNYPFLNLNWRKGLNEPLNHKTDPIFEFRVPKTIEIDMYDRFLSFFWLLPLITSPPHFEKCYNLAPKLSN